MSDFVRELLVYSPSIPAPVQTDLAGEFHELARNRHLADDAIKALAGAKLESSLAVALYRKGRFDTPTLTSVLRRERRKQPLVALIDAHRDLIDDSHVALLPPKAAPEAFGALLHCPKLSNAQRQRVLERADAVSALDWMLGCTPSELSDDALLDALEKINADVGMRDRAKFSARLSLLVNIRPATLAYAVDPRAPEALMTAAAGAATLLDPDLQKAIFTVATKSVRTYTMMALAANPATHPDLRSEIKALGGKFISASQNAHGVRVHQDKPVSRVDDREVVAALLRRALPSGYRPAGRPGVALAVAYSQQMRSDEAVRLAEYLRACQTSPWAVVPVPSWVAQPALAALQDNYEQVSPALERFDTEHRAWQDIEDDSWRHLGFSPEKLSDWSPQMFPSHNISALDVITRELGDDPMVWRVMLSLAGHFTQSVRELIDVSRASVG